MNPNQLANLIDFLSFYLQMQNSEAIKIDQLHDEFNNKIDHQVNDKLDEIIKRLDRIERKINY